MSRQNKRKTGKEQYYTSLQDARWCVDVLFGLVNTEDRTFVEPAGGKGSFLDALLECGIRPKDILSWDIKPEHPLILPTVDFIQEDTSHLKGCVSVGNPPFGRANSLSVPFFNKCATFSDCIAFIVPASWRKWSVTDRLDRNFHLIKDLDFNRDFEYDGNKEKSKGKLKTCFQVWERRDYLRDLSKVEDRGYIQKVKPSEADVALTIFGRSCGRVEQEFERRPNTTKMFLKVKDQSVANALCQLNYKTFSQNVAFVEALSIKEIRHLLNEYFDNND